MKVRNKSQGLEHRSRWKMSKEENAKRGKYRKICVRKISKRKMSTRKTPKRINSKEENIEIEKEEKKI